MNNKDTLAWHSMPFITSVLQQQSGFHNFSFATTNCLFQCLPSCYVCLVCLVISLNRMYKKDNRIHKFNKVTKGAQNSTFWSMGTAKLLLKIQWVG